MKIRKITVSHTVLYTISLFVIILGISSCRELMRQKINVVEISEIYNQEGMVTNYLIDDDKPKVINYFATPANLKKILSHTPSGKIDKIIEENPEFDFLFYCGLNPADTIELVSLLKRYNCHFPVMFDKEGVFAAKNRKNLSPQGERPFTSIGWICDSDGGVYEISVIGTTQSFFDSYFRQVRRSILHRERKK